MATENHQKNIATTKKRLNAFLTNNPYSDVEFMDKFLVVSKPWNDESLILVLSRRARKKSIEVLNSLILPPKFTAIYHTDTNTMEYIFDRIKENDPILSRQFIFNLDDK